MKSKKLLQIEETSSDAFALDVAREVSKLLDAKLTKLHPPVNDDPFITRQDVADMFHITLPTVHAWVHANILKPYKIGNKTRFLLSEVKSAALNTTTKKNIYNA